LRKELKYLVSWCPEREKRKFVKKASGNTLANLGKEVLNGNKKQQALLPPLGKCPEVKNLQMHPTENYGNEDT